MREKRKSKKNYDKNFIDLTFLEGATKGNKEYMIEIIDTFLEQTKKALNTIRSSIDKKDWHTVNQTAHQIRPSFGYIKIKDLENLIILIESYALTKENLCSLPQLISQMDKIFKRASNKLIEYKINLGNNTINSKRRLQIYFKEIS